MNTTSKVPALFAWGRDGVPLEVELYIRKAGERSRSQRNRARPAGVRSIDFDEDGVRALANEFIGRLTAEIDQFSRAKGRHPKLSTELAGWCYLLHAYCAKFQRAAPAELLQLTFAALGLVELHSPPEIQRAIGVPRGVVNILAFVRAARRDAEADHVGEELTVAALAREVSVDRRTLRRWRDAPEYKRIRRQWL